MFGDTFFFRNAVVRDASGLGEDIVSHQCVIHLNIVSQTGGAVLYLSWLEEEKKTPLKTLRGSIWGGRHHAIYLDNSGCLVWLKETLLSFCVSSFFFFLVDFFFYDMISSCFLVFNVGSTSCLFWLPESIYIPYLHIFFFLSSFHHSLFLQKLSHMFARIITRLVWLLLYYSPQGFPEHFLIFAWFKLGSRTFSRQACSHWVLPEAFKWACSLFF